MLAPSTLARAPTSTSFFGVDSAHTANCASHEDVDLSIQQQAVQLDAGAHKVIMAAAVLARLEDPEVAK